MELPKLPAQTSPFLWGAATGAIVLSIVGFNWGGWVTGGSAETLALERAQAATVAALAPICVAQFRASSGRSASIAEMKDIATWQHTEYVAKRGWATMPGSGADAEPNREVASACAEAISQLAL